jgi:hypothetical protein
MYFRLCEHYDTNNSLISTFETGNRSVNECFICFEYKNEDAIIPIYLKNQSLYLTQCVCNGSVHNECLKIWFYKNKTCPICRIKVIENNKATVIIYNYIPYGILIYTYIKIITLTLTRICLFFILLYLFIDFYFVIINSKYREYNDYTHTSMPILDYEDIE